MIEVLEHTQKRRHSSLERPVLVLNKHWTPNRVDTVRDALTLLCGEEEAGGVKARIIDPFDNFATYTWEDWSNLKIPTGAPVIHGVRQLFRVPEVVLLAHYDQTPNNRVKYSRRAIHRRDNSTCQYCGCRPGTEELTIDHVIPRAQGGQTTWVNTVTCCIRCNQVKNSRTPEQAGMKLIRPPFKPAYDFLKTRGRVLKSWVYFLPKNFDAIVSEMYWEVPLENDEVD